MNIFKSVFHALNAKRVKYMVAGGIAVNLYGIDRATADLDIAILLDAGNVERFIHAANELGLRPRIPAKLEDFADPEKRRAWIAEKGMKVFSLLDPKNPFFLIDVFTEVTFDFTEAYRRRNTVRFENTAIPLVPLDILIEMKRDTGRPQDRADVFYLTRIREIHEDDG
jgi:hypothetical protein